MDAFKSVGRLLAVCSALVLILTPLYAQAQAPLEPLTPVTGLIEPGGEQSWAFTGAGGQALSFLVTAQSGDLDPAFSLRNSGGATLIGSDDYNYPASSDALLEAITLPRTDTYTLTVTGYDGTSGEYRLTMLPGFSQVNRSDNFNGDLEWETASDALQLEASDGQLWLSLSGMRQTGIALNPGWNTPDNYYAQVAINVGGGDGWMVGLTARQQDMENYYLLTINDLGQWRFEIQEAGSRRTLRDWTPHPAIIPGGTEFSLGLLVNGAGFDFFYNRQLFGRLTDATLPLDGQLGLAVETPGTLDTQTRAAFDDLIVTVPTQLDGQGVIPQRLIVAEPTDMVQELQRRRLIPTSGEMALTVNESFVESRRPGVEQLLLGRGATYRDFAIGAAVSWQAAAAGMTGCGLVLRAEDESRYILAYVDQSGGYGLSQREGDAFTPGIFGEKPAANEGAHHLLVIARADTLYYYLDGEYAGMLEALAVEGAVGNAVVNFEPISTSCQFAETWVWRWEEN